MDTKKHIIGDKEVTEYISADILIRDTDDALDIIGNSPTLYIILYEHNFDNEFFDLSTKKLGDVLQKFTNYRLRLAIIGDFAKYPSKALKDFIYESNNHKEYLFVSSLDEVIKIWKR